MPEGVDIDVETVDLDNQSDNVSRVKRFLFNVRILYHIFPFVFYFQRFSNIENLIAKHESWSSD